MKKLLSVILAAAMVISTSAITAFTGIFAPSSVSAAETEEGIAATYYRLPWRAYVGSGMLSEDNRGARVGYENNKQFDDTIDNLLAYSYLTSTTEGETAIGTYPGGDYYIVKWTGTLTAKEAGTYTIVGRKIDNGFVMFVDGNKVYEYWGASHWFDGGEDRLPSDEGTFTLEAGQTVDVEMYYLELDGGEACQIHASNNGGDDVNINDAFALNLTREIYQTGTDAMNNLVGIGSNGNGAQCEEVNFKYASSINRLLSVLRKDETKIVSSFADAVVGEDSYIILYSGMLTPKASGTYTFGADAVDNGFYFEIDGTTVYEMWAGGTWNDNGGNVYPDSIELEAGVSYPFKAAFLETNGGEALRLNYRIGDGETVSGLNNGFTFIPYVELGDSYFGIGTGCGFLDGNVIFDVSLDVDKLEDVNIEVNGKPAYWNIGCLGYKHCQLADNGMSKNWLQLGIVGADLVQGSVNTLTLTAGSYRYTNTFSSDVNALGTSYAKVTVDNTTKNAKAEFIFNKDVDLAVGTALTGQCHDDHSSVGNFTVTGKKVVLIGNTPAYLYTIESDNFTTNQSLLELTISEGAYKNYKISATVNSKEVYAPAALSTANTNAVVNGATKQTLSNVDSHGFGNANNLVDGATSPKLEGNWPGGNGVTITFETAEAVEATYLVLYTHDDGSWGNRAPQAFTLSGSADGENYTVIKDVKVSGIQNVSNAPFAFALNDAPAYKYYKLEIHSNLGNGGYFQIGEMELYTGSVTLPDAVPTNPTTTQAAGVAYNGTPATTNDVFTINSADELVAFANAANEAGPDYMARQTIVVTADLDMTGKDYTPIASALFVLDFWGHTVSNLHVTREVYGGDVGLIADLLRNNNFNAGITNIKLKDSSLTVTNLGEGYANVGGVAGRADRAFVDVAELDNVTITVRGYANVGSVVGKKEWGLGRNDMSVTLKDVTINAPDAYVGIVVGVLGGDVYINFTDVTGTVTVTSANEVTKDTLYAYADNYWGSVGFGENIDVNVIVVDPDIPVLNGQLLIEKPSEFGGDVGIVYYPVEVDDNSLDAFYGLENGEYSAVITVTGGTQGYQNVIVDSHMTYNSDYGDALALRFDAEWEGLRLSAGYEYTVYTEIVDYWTGRTIYTFEVQTAVSPYTTRGEEPRSGETEIWPDLDGYYKLTVDGSTIWGENTLTGEGIGYFGAGEGLSNLFDGVIYGNKTGAGDTYLTFGWSYLEAKTVEYIVLYTGGDTSRFSTRNPISWVMYGSNDGGDTWTVVDVVEYSGMGEYDETPYGRDLSNPGSYISYKIEFVTGGQFQLAEIETYTTDASESDEFTIDTPEDLVEFAKRVNEDPNYMAYQTIKVTADLDMTGLDYTPFKSGLFVLDFQGHTVSNLNLTRTVSGDANIGLIADELNNSWFNAGIINIKLKDCSLTVTNIGEGEVNVGGVVGLADRAFVDNVELENVTITVVGAANVGSVIGRKAFQCLNNGYDSMSVKLNGVTINAPDAVVGIVIGELYDNGEDGGWLYVHFDEVTGDITIEASANTVTEDTLVGSNDGAGIYEGEIDMEVKEPTEPEPTEPDPTEPDPTEPDPTEPDPTEPDPTEPDPTEPDPTEPNPTVPKTGDIVMIYVIGMVASALCGAVLIMSMKKKHFVK